MGKIRQFAGQTLTYGLGSVLSKLVYYLLVVVLLTYLLGGREYEFGIYGELYGYVTVLIIFFSLKLDTALFRFGSKKEDFQKAFETTGTLVFVSALFIISFGFIFTEDFASFIGYADRPKYIRWFSLILAFDIMALIPFARLRLNNKARHFALLKIFNVLFSSALILFFLIVFPKMKDAAVFRWLPHFDYQIDYVILTNILSSFLVLLILVFLTGFSRLKIDYPLVKKIIPYVLPLVIVGMCNNFIQYNGAAVIKFLYSGDSLLDKLSASGVFDSSRRLAGLFVLFIGAFNYAAEPFFFNNHKTEDREALYGKICHLFVLIGGLIILGLVCGIDIIKFLVGKDFRESLFIVPILLFAYLFLGVYHNISIWYKLSDKTLWGALISFLGAGITLIISVIYLPKHGYVVFAWANMLTYAIMVFLAYVLGQKYYPINYPLKKILLSIGVLALIVVASVCLQNHLSGIPLYALYVVFVALYGYYAYLSEREEWHSLFTRSRS